MSAAEEAIKSGGEASADPSTIDKKAKAARPASKPILNRALDFLSSVRFGVTLLVILVALSMVGMLIVQQNVQGFEPYFASLTPAEKWLFGTLGFFDVYHSWYYNLLLLVLSLNIVLASIDHFPSSWDYIVKPKLNATRGWLLNQKQNAVVEIEAANETEAAEKLDGIFKANGFKTQITSGEQIMYAVDENGKKDFSKTLSKSYFYVFGERGKWNRMGAYLVHVALLTLFLGHFVALQTGFDADVRLMPGQTTNKIELIEFQLDKQERFSVDLPFTINCTDIQQRLIDPKGTVDISNTLDWRTRISIDDPQYGVTTADVSLNKPFSYRGYRFFQASAITLGNARTMTLELTPQNGGESLRINLERNGSTKLPDGTQISYDSFYPDFSLINGKADTRSGEYNNPAVKLLVETPQGERKTAYAFATRLPDNAPVGASVGGYKFHLADFEKSPLAHVLSIKYDPFQGAFIAWYIGGIGLIFALCFVFFLSHQRVWALIERKDSSGIYEVVLGGHTNRNHFGFEDKFKKITRNLTAADETEDSRES